MPTDPARLPKNALSLRTSNYIRALIAAQGVDQLHFAPKIGIGASHFSKILNRQRGASLDLLEAIGRELRRPVGELLDPPNTTAADDEVPRTDVVEALRADVAELRLRFERLEQRAITETRVPYGGQLSGGAGAGATGEVAVTAIVRQLADGVRALLAYAERTSE